MRKFLVFIVALALSFIIPYGLAKVVSDLVMENITVVGATYYFLGALSHRFAQFIISTGLFVLIFNKTDIKMGFAFKYVMSKVMLFKWVLIIWPILTAAFFLMTTHFIEGFKDYLSNLYPSSIDWFFAKIGRDIFLLDALAEEVLNRALVIGLLSIYWRKKHATLLSVPIFSLAHIQVTIFPFSVVGYDPVQLCLTLFTGFLFAYSYEKTKNIIVPILLHGYTNMIITLVAYLTLITV